MIMRRDTTHAHVASEAKLAQQKKLATIVNPKAPKMIGPGVTTDSNGVLMAVQPRVRLRDDRGPQMKYVTLTSYENEPIQTKQK
jgi:hypothetical protein